jgi:hypothetical protein
MRHSQGPRHLAKEQTFMRWSRIWPISGLVLVALACGWLVVPKGLDALIVAQEVDDPVAAVDFGLARVATPARLNQELAAARQSGDRDLADSLTVLAADRHVIVDLAPADGSPPGRSSALQDFARGFADGSGASAPGYAGSLLGDISGYGDLRDLIGEGRKLVRGEQADELVVGLASVGLIVSGATWWSLGAALPARSGLTVTKALVRSGRLSKPLAASLARLVGLSIDRQTAQESLAALTRFDLAAARRIAFASVKPEALHELETLATNTGRLYERIGARGTREVFGMAETTQEVERAASLAQTKGPMTLAILRVLGRAALTAGAFGLTIFAWLGTAMLYLFALACLARRLGLWLGRRLWRMRGGPRVPGPNVILAAPPCTLLDPKIVSQLISIPLRPRGRRLCNPEAWHETAPVTNHGNVGNFVPL